MSFKISSYYMGSSSVNGFQTQFDKQMNKNGYFTYIIKGGAGTGKSSLMKKIVEEFKDYEDIDIYYCSSDPSSLDAVVLKKHKIIVVDGTSPHVFDPIYPGIMQKIVNLGEYWDEKMLQQNALKIVKTIDENQKLHKRTRRFISAVSSLYSDTYSIAEETINHQKLSGFINRLVKKLFPTTKEISRTPKYAQISALTSDGYKTLTQTIANYKNIYIIDDNYFAGSDLFMREIARISLQRGINVIISQNMLFPSKIYEHILIPELSIAFISRNSINEIEIEHQKSINFLRFYDREKLVLKKQRIAFNKKASADLLEEAANTLKRAKAVHDEIELYYINAMDYSKVDSLKAHIVDEIYNSEK